MNPNEYQEGAARTICPQNPATGRLMANPAIQGLNHAIVGIAGEAGELASLLEKYLWYSQPLDKKAFFEEFGDLLWYVAEGLSALDFKLEDVMEANIRKLKARYPEKYTDEGALNRDKEKEGKEVKVTFESALRKTLGMPPPDKTEVTEAEAHCVHDWKTFQKWDNGTSLRQCTKCRIQEFVAAENNPK